MGRGYFALNFFFSARMKYVQDAVRPHPAIFFRLFRNGATPCLSIPPVHTATAIYVAVSTQR